MTFKAGEIPEIWEIAALLRLDRLHRAVVAGKEDAFAVGLFRQSQAAAVRTQAGETLNELRFRHVKMTCQLCDFTVGEFDLARPAAAGGAALAFVKDRHAGLIKDDLVAGTSPELVRRGSS